MSGAIHYSPYTSSRCGQGQLYLHLYLNDIFYTSVVYPARLSVSLTARCGVARRAVKTELERTWKESIVAHCNPGVCLEELRRTTKTAVRIAGTRAEIRIPKHRLLRYCVPFMARLQALTADDSSDCSPAKGHVIPWSKDDVSETCSVSIVTADVVRRNPSSLCMYMVYPISWT